MRYVGSATTQWRGSLRRSPTKARLEAAVMVGPGDIVVFWHATARVQPKARFGVVLAKAAMVDILPILSAPPKFSPYHRIDLPPRIEQQTGLLSPLYVDLVDLNVVKEGAVEPRVRLPPRLFYELKDALLRIAPPQPSPAEIEDPASQPEIPAPASSPAVMLASPSDPSDGQ